MREKLIIVLRLFHLPFAPFLFTCVHLFLSLSLSTNCCCSLLSLFYHYIPLPSVCHCLSFLSISPSLLLHSGLYIRLRFFRQSLFVHLYHYEAGCCALCCETRHDGTKWESQKERRREKREINLTMFPHTYTACTTVAAIVCLLLCLCVWMCGCCVLWFRDRRREDEKPIPRLLLLFCCCCG